MNPSGSDRITQQHFFLSTLREGLTSEQHLLVARRAAWIDKTTGKPREAFPAEMWREQYLDGPWYFNTGASDSKKSRTNDHIVALRAIVLDDVGSKVDPDKIKAAPTWVLETSAGNFQWGFLLKEWTTDIEGGDALFAGLIAAGLQDPGVNKCCRLFRIPGSINDKPGRDGFVSVLHDFTPERVYTLKSLAAALGVKPGHAPKHHVDTGERPATGKPDPTFDWLRARGMVQSKASGGWWYIDCPFKDEHTDGRDEARYLPLSEANTGRSNVECWHGHGQDKDAYRRRFKQWLADEGAPPMDGNTPEGDMNAFREFMRGLPNGKSKPQVRKQVAEDAQRYTYAGLGAALGSIPKGEMPDVEVTAEGHTKAAQPCTNANVEFGLNSLGVQVRFNLMSAKTSFILPERIDMAGFQGMTPHEVDGMIDGALGDRFIKAGIKNMNDLGAAITRIAAPKLWHPAKDWIESVGWDGKDRFEALAATVSTPTPDLFRMYLRRWLLQTVECAAGWAVGRRESQKGLCLVLAGPQNMGKTKWFKALAGDNLFSRMGKHLNLNGLNARDSKHEALQGWIVELGELDTTFKQSDLGALKAFITTEVDEYRLPYDRRWTERPRTTSFCGTVNHIEFLRDPTGSRRFAVVEVSSCQYDHGIDMQQVFAQVHSWWLDGEKWWLNPEETALQAKHNEQFNTIDTIEERVESELHIREDRAAYPMECSMNRTQIADMLGIDLERSKDAMPRLSDALKKLLGKPADYRMRVADGSRGCTREGWIFWLTSTEVAKLRIKTLRPVKA